MSYPKLSILIPAAGASERLGQPKQLVRYKGGTLIQNVIDTAFSIGPREVIVVTGAYRQAVRDAVQQGQVRWVHNTNWADGMGSSIAIGATVINPGSSAVMILLCDQWGLQTADLQLVVQTWQAHPERIVSAQAGSQNLPPVIFPAGLYQRLLSLGGDEGARKLVKEHQELLTTVACNNALFDLDEQSQLEKLKITDL